jgi:hypothetical protein
MMLCTMTSLRCQYALYYGAEEYHLTPLCSIAIGIQTATPCMTKSSTLFPTEQALWLKICSTGKQRLWVQQKAHMLVVSFWLPSTSLRTTRSSHQRYGVYIISSAVQATFFFLQFYSILKLANRPI